MFILYLVGVGLWKLFVGSLYLVFYFFAFAWLVLLATGKATAAACRLVAATWRALMQKAEQKGLQQPTEPSAEPAPIEDTKPSIKAKPGPRDYNLPE